MISGSGQALVNWFDDPLVPGSNMFKWVESKLISVSNVYGFGGWIVFYSFIYFYVSSISMHLRGNYWCEIASIPGFNWKY